jgi:hypothetical protein
MGRMGSVAAEVAIASAGFVLSLAGSMFVAGSRWGRVESDVRIMADRLAKIEGMFTLRLRDDDQRRSEL